MNLDDAKTRKDLLPAHPIVTKGYRIATFAIVEAYKQCRRRVALRQPSVYFRAPPRTGKSEAAEAIEELLRTEFKRAFGLLISADGVGGGKNHGVIRDVASAAGLALRDRVPYKLMLSRLVMHIASELEARGGNHFWLIVDEFHVLPEEDLRQLATLQNRLRLTKSKITMTVIGFAQPEIESKRSALLATDMRNLVARLLSEGLDFKSCRGVEELRKITRALDAKKEFPDASGWSYVRFFLPQAYSAGFRLTTYSEPLLNALIDAASGLDPIPMEHIMRTLEAMLLLNSGRDAPDFKVTEPMIKKAVAASHLAAFASNTRFAPP